jgi:8-oxo-dGTP pyrophosphatase MutT (NUDIX family)
LNYEKSCGAIVFRRNHGIKYLLLHYTAGHWGFVKGNVDGQEEEKETVLRELEEETGFSKGMFIGDFREKVIYFYRRRKEIIQKEVIYFLIEVSNGPVRLSHEHVGHDWMPFTKSLQTLTFDNTRRVLRRAHEYLKN